LYHLLVLPQLQRSIRTYALFRSGDRVGVAVSGGADSVALLRALLDLRSELGVVLSIVHLHHGIRGAEADGDEQFVSGLAANFDLPLHLEHADVPAHSKHEKLSLETSARDLRYAYFQRLLAANVCDKIATAHTLDDQAETVLLRILRGTGTRGLAAIPPLRDASPDLVARIVRPLLGTGRPEVETYLRSIDQPWREDASNRDPRHLRNRIRHELLPQLESDYNPALRQSLVNLAEIARAEEQHWSVELARVSSLLVKPSSDGITLDRAQFLALSLALQRRMLLEQADLLNLPAGFDEIERMLRIATHPGTEHEFEAGWRVASTRQQLSISRIANSTMQDNYDLALPVPGEVALPSTLRLRATRLQHAEIASYNSSTLLAHDGLQLPLQVRNWQPGDRFWPVGSKQAEKLKRLFQQQHIPAEARSAWPLVLSAGTIVWVRGFPVATGHQVRDNDAVLIEIVDRGETRLD
jgi:tRNA(Ile)-lysidine synthase